MALGWLRRKSRTSRSSSLSPAARRFRFIAGFFLLLPRAVVENGGVETASSSDRVDSMGIYEPVLTVSVFQSY